MKNSRFWIAIGSSLFVFVGSAILFSWEMRRTMTFSYPIDADRFADFGGFIGGILGFVNFILLLYMFKDGRDQADNSFFFSSLQIHDALVSQLRSNNEALKVINSEISLLFVAGTLCQTVEARGLGEECRVYQKKDPPTEYFEAMYRMLHISYKYKNQKLERFYRDHNWRMGHYFRSFLALMELIDNSGLSEPKKEIHARLLQARSSSDELRLVLYYILSFDHQKNTDQGTDQATVQAAVHAERFSRLQFYSAITDPLIDDDNDRQAFERLAKAKLR